MGNLCGGPRKQNTYKKSNSFLSNYRINEFGEAKIILLGLDNAGKTSIYNTLLGKSNDDLKKTTGFNT